ncbi:Nucleoside-diphosphate-sugar epimerase [Collimonas sp. OK607]|uniref:NAD-dependent epimerase/dehydratase family protein n=1 Tax=Collimonas sp. OK607 TaxID=1798194 RepID=UPI0008E0F36D|nr:NAD-dependent epimerase/dehydratase family protein [Collimonas sp. OK607]SFB27561.1 Nucleoside-diphosphate-sugar epimerase [Collimonas sp. OK607]
MHILVTGANGFVGQNLVRRLLQDGRVGSDAKPFSTLTLVDIGFEAAALDPRVRQFSGSIADPETLNVAFAQPADYVFHLASIAGGAAEKNYDLGLAVNLHASIAILELLRKQTVAARLVFASTVAVYGAPMPPLVDDSTPMRPGLSYGAHKLAAEVLIQDYSRRGWIDGRIVRLPGIVARPPASSGLLSAFMSDIFWRLAEGKEFVCPVSPQAVAWWMSVRCCVDNLLHAASLSAEQTAERRDYTLPVLRLGITELIDGLAVVFGADRRALVTYDPNEQLEAAFGRQPPLDAAAAQRTGFRHDGSIEALIAGAMANSQ